MASRWPSVGPSLRRSSLQGHKQLEEVKELQPAAHEASCGALGSLRRQLQRRLPLRTVSLNLGPSPSWKRLEAPEPEPEQQGLQAAARSARNALGAMSQRIQESCQSGTKWLVETHVKARRRKMGIQKGSSPPAHSLSQRSTRVSRATPVRPTSGPWEREHSRLSALMGPHAHPLRRSRREAAFRSPYSSTEPLCSPSESDSDLEPVGAGLQHLQKLSQELDEVIMAEESDDMTASLLRH
ncbi:protein PIMREG [Erinaceus europaeus]|uniref:Protein PIMREG n=1 Tax=Erinaceus europaeus TaxID=9365 RepID=A0A1S2ZQZ4_ERIEU|nr:protein PIMREG [Erinaceus europaeus]